VVQGLAVRAVDAGEGEPGDVGAEQPGPEVLLARQAHLGEGGRLAAQDRDAVPGLLPVAERSVARVLQLGVWELLVGELQLLQPDDVRLALA
jgi:hypothetical protein